MKNRITNQLKNAIASLTIAACATTALADPFTYQGQLNDNGSPANGSYDFALRLYDAPTGGTQLGSTVQLANVPVTDGLFEVQPDFGLGVFENLNLHIEVLVRPGGSVASFTQLLPRTKINPTPQAQHAQTADQLTNPTWTQAPGIITYGDGQDRALINRSSPITPAEYFGVHAERTGFVGMYVSGPTGSLPFYGYSVNGVVNAYTSYNEASNTWRLTNVGATVLSVDNQGNLETTGDTIAENFSYKAPRVGYISVSGESFHSTSDDRFFASIGNGGAYMFDIGNGVLVAPIQLPHGATITQMQVFGNDEANFGNLTVTLQYLGHGAGVFAQNATVVSSGTPGVFTLTDNSITNPIVDNQAYHYHLEARSSNWPGDQTLSIKSVLITYVKSQAD